jgi:hypothetical protein
MRFRDYRYSVSKRTTKTIVTHCLDYLSVSKGTANIVSDYRYRKALPRLYLTIGIERYCQDCICMREASRLINVNFTQNCGAPDLPKLEQSRHQYICGGTCTPYRHRYSLPAPAPGYMSWRQHAAPVHPPNVCLVATWHCRCRRNYRYGPGVP